MSHIAGLTMLFCLATVAAHADDKPEKPKTIKYEIVDQTEVMAKPNSNKRRAGVLTKVIVIDRKHVNEADVRALGDQIREDFKKERATYWIVDVRIFDDAKAARLWKDAKNDRLNKKDGDYFDQHFLGTYFTNSATKLDHLVVSLKPPDGEPKFEVKYKQ